MGKEDGRARRGLGLGLRLIGVPVLPALYVLAVAVVQLDALDKVIVLLLTLLSIGLLFPATRSWVLRFIDRLETLARPSDRAAGRRQ
jgi:hypothetical protein